MMLFWDGWLAGRRADELARLEPLVVISRGHSGTRVLTWLCVHLGFNLGTHEDNPTADADKRFTNQIKKIAAHTHACTAADQVQEDHLRVFQRAVWRYYQRLGAPVSAWGWKFPETYLMVPLVARTFPRARYLHLLRDGRDIAFKKHLTDRPDNPVGHSILAACDALAEPHPVQAARSWEYQVRQYEKVRALLPPDRVLDLRFEDLCRDPAGVGEQVRRFLGVPMTEAARNYLASKVDAGKLEQYRNEDPAQVRQIEQHIGSTLKHLGYPVPG
jgi:hypothetical protein